MKKYFIFFSNSEAFLRFQYICQKIKTNSSNNNIVIADFIGKELNIVYLKKGQSKLIIKDLKLMIKDCKEILIINFKNKLTIDLDYLDFFESIQTKNYKYLENKIYSCNHDRLNLAMRSLLEDISSSVAKKDLTFEIQAVKSKKEVLDYFEYVTNMVRINLDSKIIYDILYITYCINKTDSFLTKAVFYSRDANESLEKSITNYKNILSKLKTLYIKGIITYPFEDECELIKKDHILIEERRIIEELEEEPTKIVIHDRNSIFFADIAFVYHIENEDIESENFIKTINLCIEKNILYFSEGKLYMTKNGVKLYNSILDRDLEQYLIKGF